MKFPGFEFFLPNLLKNIECFFTQIRNISVTIITDKYEPQFFKVTPTHIF